MNKVILRGIAVFTLLAIAFLIEWGMRTKANGAVISSGVTFTTNQTVEYYHLNNAINNATISDITSGDILDGTISLSDMGANSVNSAKVVDGSLTAADHAPYIWTSGYYATNSVGGAALSTDLVARNGSTWTLTNGVLNVGNSNTTINLSGSVLQFSQGQIPQSAISNLTLSSLVITNMNGATGSGSGNTWSEICRVTTTATTGTVTVVGRALTSVGATGVIWMRVRDNPETKAAVYAQSAFGANVATPLMATLVDQLTGSTKTYIMDVACPSASQTFTNFSNTGVNNNTSVSNMLGMVIKQTP